MAWGFLLYTLQNIEGVSVFPLFFDFLSLTGWSVCVSIRRHAYTHTTRGVLRVECEPWGRDDSLGGPKESRWTPCRHICICIEGPKGFSVIYLSP